MGALLRFPGAHRTRDPAHTLRIVSTRLAEFGITRLADVTDLDDIGIPVVMSVRPQAATLTVSQGKGATLELAKVSAAMEAIELWHAENLTPETRIPDRSALELSLPYDITGLDQYPGSLLTSHTRLDWIAAQNLVDGTETFVPRETVALGRQPPSWHLPQLVSSSNGLASGNTLNEATVHALYEVIERDCRSVIEDIPSARRQLIDPDSVAAPDCRQLLEQVRASGAWSEIVDVTAPRWRPIHCFVYHLWLPDTAVMARGSGAHRDPAIALSRAITEAVQSRLTMIVGTRDDITPRAYDEPDTSPPRSQGTVVSWGDAVTESHTDTTTDHAEAAWLVDRVWDTVGQPPLRVDLTRAGDRRDFAVVRVRCPGLDFRPPHSEGSGR